MAMNDEYEQAFISDGQPEEEVTEDMVEMQPEEDAAEVMEQPVEIGVALDEEDEPTDEKELQRKRSWEGRLRAREAELKAREEGVMGRESGNGYPAETQDAPATEEAAMSEAVEKLEDGFSADEVMQQMAEDFGDDFAQKLSKLIRHEAKKIASQEAGQLDQKVNGIVSSFKDAQVRSHFSAIEDAHPDYVELAQGGAMQAYLESLSEEDRAQAVSIVSSGTANQVIKLLGNVKAFKGEAGKQDSVDEVMAEAAEGVRSRGMSLPEKPRGNSYEEAWNEL